MNTELEERYLAVLIIVVENFINYKEAVGSRILIKRYNLPFSAATLRNIMFDLEEMGYLKHSYISSGKIPSEKGYKAYVHYLVENKKTTANIKLKQIEQLHLNTMSDLMMDISKLISNLSGLISMVSSPNIFKLKLEKISFIKIGKRKVLSIIMAEPSIVETNIIDTSRDYDVNELIDMADFIEENYKGWELEKIKEDLKENLVASKIECESIFNKLQEKSKDLYLSGVQNLIKEKEFYENYKQINNILNVIEKRKYVTEIVDMILKSNENILIGTDIPNEKLQNMSLITQPYFIGDIKLGMVGVLGPMNLNYENIISTLDVLSKKIEKLLRSWR